MIRKLLAVVMGLFACTPAQAGLYYSGETFASLPTQWRGFLMDHRLLRNIAVKPKTEAEASPLRQRYREEADKLDALGRKQKLKADELADLGALLVRLGDAERAVEVLRKAHEVHPNHFAVAANLGSAWQMLGDYRQAEAALEAAVRLAPGKLQAYEEAHLKLVRSRSRGKAGELDNLFGVTFINDKGKYEPGKIAAAQLKKRPSNAVAVAQQLALWFPADGPLLWQLAELANSEGDIRNAASMMEGCVVQFGMSNPTLRQHRQILREAADKTAAPKIGDDHAEIHAGTLAFKSRRPLISKLETLPLPAIDLKGVNAIPWELFGETAIEKPYKPSFPKYLRELAGKQVSMNGFMYPLRDDPEMAAFLFIESPVGCWYCEMPDTTGIVFVQMPDGQAARYQRGLVRIVGRLHLNTTDPEDFLYSVKDARVGAID
jgi:hypothetical protein